MLYRVENNVIVGGPFNCAQSFSVVEYSNDAPEVLAFEANVAALQASAETPQKKLEAFLAENPDVAPLVKL
jgi:hypothetical protein